VSATAVAGYRFPWCLNPSFLKIINNCMSWLYPSAIVNHETGQISWSGSFPLETILPLTGVATSTGSMVLKGSNALRLTFPVALGAATPVGLEFRIQSQRWARIEESVVQLWNGRELCGVNCARRSTDNVAVFGGGSDQWGVDVGMWTDAWAVVVDFEPAARTPSANRLIVYEFALQFHYL